ncbi:hypothetical protein BpHYR1_035597 [Brachionus plicatilis]|uniref:Uncharacterized protein n=1 Tax=Brachionus plicatilis TaxID=10195 RepID=A0A3M7RAL3_BRAPC|nr:hypothetical protein BpHYR1_035597 [Brachionus plicatilis]
MKFARAAANKSQMHKCRILSFFPLFGRKGSLFIRLIGILYFPFNMQNNKMELFIHSSLTCKRMEWTSQLTIKLINSSPSRRAARHCVARFSDDFIPKKTSKLNDIS